MAHNREKTIPVELHAQTKVRRGQSHASGSRVAPAFKAYANPQEVVALPVPQLKGGQGVWTTLSQARDGAPEGGRVRQAQVSQLLWSAAGFTFGGERTHLSARAVSSLETYVLARQVEDLFPGAYHYSPRDHTLEQLGNGEPVARLAESLVPAIDPGPQALAVCFTGVPGRHRALAPGRPFRYAYLDAGAAAQAVVLACAALGLAGASSADFYDDELAALLQIDGRAEIPLCVVAIGP